MTEKRTSSARARSGFTLAELLIVTGIVSILVAVSIPIMSGQVQKAKEVRAKAEARILCTALWMYLHDLDEQGIHPESWELMMDLGGSFRDRGENPLENYLDGEISEDVSIYSVYYSDTLESYGGNLVRDRWNRGGSADKRKDGDCESINKRERQDVLQGKSCKTLLLSI